LGRAQIRSLRLGICYPLVKQLCLQ
jgi:hypothetical protein